MDHSNQPELIPISDTLRLRKYDGRYETMLDGYQDPVVYRNSEGILDDEKKPDLEYIRGMCEYLSGAGEFYYIEALEDGRFLPIGDGTIKPVNPPLAVWYERYRGRGIGTAVMRTVIARLKSLGYEKITGSTVYRWNPVSRALHEKLGFRQTGENEREYFYELDLTSDADPGPGAPSK